MKKRYEVGDTSYMLACTINGLKNQCMEKTVDFDGAEFEILEEDCSLPVSKPNRGERNNTIIADLKNNNIFFIQESRLREIIPEKMIEVGGKEYSESTLKSALKDYVG